MGEIVKIRTELQEVESKHATKYIVYEGREILKPLSVHCEDLQIQGSVEWKWCNSTGKTLVAYW